MARRLLLAGFFVAATQSLSADIGAPVASDFDAKFARAAELLEAGRRPEALSLLAQVRAQASRPAWEARAAMLLAADDGRRRDFRTTVEELSRAPASAIGLEPYRRWHLGRALSALGRWDEAAENLRGAFETDEPFAMRVSAGRDWAGVLEKKGRPSEAARVLARVAAQASPAEAGSVGVERIRLALVLRDRGAVQEAARAMVAAGVDAGRALPAFARGVVAEEIARLTPPQRARFARSRIAADDVERGMRLLKQDNPQRWPREERAANLLALARAERRLGYGRTAEATLAKVPQDESPAALEAKLLRVDLALEKVHRKFPSGVPPEEAALSAAREMLAPLAELREPLLIRIEARQRLIRIAADRGRFEEGVSLARRLVAESPEPGAAFEPLWKLAWMSYLTADFRQAESRFDELSSLRPGLAMQRRLNYWRGRCLEKLGRSQEAATIFQALAESQPADVYALFARRRVGTLKKSEPTPVTNPSTATATFRRADELLRLRFFAEAAAEAQTLPRSRGRDLRLAQADFALGRFAAAVVFAKRAFPEMGTAAEGNVPDGWRRLYYPIEDGTYLAERAREFGLEPSTLRALVRQESVFEASARSRAGALGLTQLMPATARSLSRSVLRRRYRQAFLYDPGINARLGAAYLKNLLDRFGGRTLYALAAYNGGPTRMERLLRENPGRPEDEIFESHPASETRDYVRRVLLYAESYRELYP